MKVSPKKYLILLILPLLLVTAGCDWLVPKATEDGSQADLASGNQPSVLAGNSDLSASAEINPEHAGLVSQNGEIRVLNPGIDDVIKSPVTVTGQARAFENTIMVKITDGDGNVLTEQSLDIDSTAIGEFGDFSGSIAFGKPSVYDKPGEIMFYEQSMKDGAEVHKVVIPVGFAK